jgi:hypothetical protein
MNGVRGCKASSRKEIERRRNIHLREGEGKPRN